MTGGGDRLRRWPLWVIALLVAAMVVVGAACDPPSTRNTKIAVGRSDRGEIEIWYFACPSSDAPRAVRIERTDAKFSVEGSIGVWSATRTAPLRPHDVRLKVSVSGAPDYTAEGELSTVPEFMNAFVEFDGGARQVISFKRDELVQGSLVVMQDRSLFPERVVSATEFERRDGGREIVPVGGR